MENSETFYDIPLNDDPTDAGDDNASHHSDSDYDIINSNDFGTSTRLSVPRSLNDAPDVSSTSVTTSIPRSTTTSASPLPSSLREMQKRELPVHRKEVGVQRRDAQKLRARIEYLEKELEKEKEKARAMSSENCRLLLESAELQRRIFACENNRFKSKIEESNSTGDEASCRVASTSDEADEATRSALPFSSSTPSNSTSPTFFTAPLSSASISPESSSTKRLPSPAPPHPTSASSACSSSEDSFLSAKE
ncbi:hypothetical protein NHQ30_000572 [Ciborinia camelliae]|nr:hypothetical protein NHQ30_000572 [Ciborinia camelliae]